jgi:hypothetical protein
MSMTPDQAAEIDSIQDVTQLQQAVIRGMPLKCHAV